MSNKSEVTCPWCGGPSKLHGVDRRRRGAFTSIHKEKIAAVKRSWDSETNRLAGKLVDAEKRAAELKSELKRQSDHFASVLAEWTDTAKEWDADPKIVFGLIHKLRDQVDQQMEVVEAAREGRHDWGVLSKMWVKHLGEALEALDKKGSE